MGYLEIKCTYLEDLLLCCFDCDLHGGWQRVKMSGRCQWADDGLGLSDA
jgi:hypothetical protein